MEYTTPHLRKLGSLAELTLGSGGSLGDNGSRTRARNQQPNSLLGSVSGQ